MKRLLLMCFLVLGSFRAYAQLCVIDGVIIPDSLLRVSVDEMRSDSAKQIVAKRLGFLSPFAIDTIQIFPKGKMQTFCREPADIILIQTNTLAQLQWVVNGKLKNPKKRLTIIDYKLSPTCLEAALPRRVKPKKIVSVQVLIPKAYTIRPEARPTIVIEMKK